MPSSFLRKQKRHFLSVSKSRGAGFNRGRPCGSLPDCGRYTGVFQYHNWGFNPLRVQISGLDPLRGYCSPRSGSLWGSPPFPCERLGNGLTVCMIGFACEGAERSCLVGSRRRKRGLRVGKHRSRVRHTRRTADTRQPIPKEYSERSFAHAIRQMDFWQLKLDQFKARADPIVKGWKSDYSSGLCSEHDVFHGDSYRRLRDRYHAVQRGISKGHMAARPLRMTFSMFLDKYYRLTQRGKGTVIDDLRSLFPVDTGYLGRPAEKKTSVSPSLSTRRKRGGSEYGRLSRSTCPHGRTLLSCPVCGKSSKPSKKVGYLN
jgi:hypothetical protein